MDRGHRMAVLLSGHAGGCRVERRELLWRCFGVRPAASGDGLEVRGEGEGRIQCNF